MSINTNAIENSSVVGKRSHFFWKPNTIYLIQYHIYRPQRSCGQGNIFTPVCHSFCSQGWGSASVHAGIPTPLGADPPGPGRPPREQTHPPGPGRPPWEQTHHPPPPRPGRPPKRQKHPPRPLPTPREADSSIRSTSGRYLSYWNAFLSNDFFMQMPTSCFIKGVSFFIIRDVSQWR